MEEPAVGEQRRLGALLTLRLGSKYRKGLVCGLGIQDFRR